MDDINILIGTALNLPIQATYCIRLGEKKLIEAEDNVTKPRLLKVVFPVLEDRNEVLAKAELLRETLNHNNKSKWTCQKT